MSGIVPLIWAFKVAPVKDPGEKLVLQSLADAGDEDGCNAYIAQATIAERAMCDVRTVRRRLADLEERGLIARGDQRAVAHIPPDKRPVVWDVLIPYTAFGDAIDSVNSFRKGKGRPPLTPQNRPALPPAPEAKTRKDKGQAKPPKRQDSETGGTSSPAGQEVRPDTESTATGLEVHPRPDLKSDNPPPKQPSPRPSPSDAEPLRDPAGDEDQPMLIVVDGLTDGTSDTRAIGAKEQAALARQITDGWFAYYEKTYAPVAGSSRVFHSLRTSIEGALKAGYTPDEIKIALANTNGRGKVPEASPLKQKFQNALVTVRAHISNQSGATVHQMPVDDPDRQRRASAW